MDYLIANRDRHGANIEVLRDTEGAMPDRRRQLREELSCQLARARKEASLTQAQLAERACVDQAVISRVERGRENVTANLLADLAEALGKQVRMTLE